MTHGHHQCHTGQHRWNHPHHDHTTQGLLQVINPTWAATAAANLEASIAYAQAVFDPIVVDHDDPGPPPSERLWASILNESAAACFQTAGSPQPRITTHQEVSNEYRLEPFPDWIARLARRPPKPRTTASVVEQIHRALTALTAGDAADRAGHLPPTVGTSAQNVTLICPPNGWPCQPCHQETRWPWEPERTCPSDVTDDETRCLAHRP